ncbi:MAG: HAD family hydrolase [Spirochaetales bacterium]|nr:HAD family hydrolase [Spirochaetales bacterium]
MSTAHDISIDRSTLLVLDFDGVICDSINECFVSSSVAYHELYKKGGLVMLPVAAISAFTVHRPFVRRGEDYLFIQEIIEKGITIRNQESFDRYCGHEGEEKKSLFKALFYQARTALLEDEREYWMGLNPVFSHMQGPLRSAIRSPGFYILSTKREDFIRDICMHWGLSPRPGCVIDSGKERKLSIVSSLLDGLKMKRAVFIDDQIDHLRENEDGRIRPCLASWGYIQKTWLASGFRVIAKQEIAGICASLDPGDA